MLGIQFNRIRRTRRTRRIRCFTINAMTIILNGENYTTKGADAVGAITVAGLLDELGIGPGAVAVEVNLSIVKKALYAETAIREGDSVEIVNFVGGG